MSKQTRFARAFEPWVERWAEMGVTAREMQVLLLLIVSMERQTGGDFVVSRPRADIAQALGISDNAVRCVIKSLRDKRILKPIGVSHSGWTQRYVVMPKDGAGKDIPIVTLKKGGSEQTHQKEKGGSNSIKKGGPASHIRGVELDPPTRSEEEGASGTPLRVRPSAQEIDYYAISEAANKGIV